jgi:hypothetical protein
MLTTGAVRKSFDAVNKNYKPYSYDYIFSVSNSLAGKSYSVKFLLSEYGLKLLNDV